MGKSVAKKYIPNPVTDAVLTGIFFLEVLFAVLALLNKDEDNYTDLLIFLFFSLLTGIAIKATEWFCHNVMAKYVSGYLLAAAPFNHPLGKKRTLDKFTGSVWQLVIHFTMSCCEIALLWDESWISHPATCFEPQPYIYTPKYSLRVFFIAQIAVWILTCFSHRFNSDAHAHKDYFVMYLHHLVTIGLVTVAYWDNHSRPGIIVLLVHEVSDIGIDLMKCMNYLRLEGKSGWYIVEISYACCVALWVYFRLYLYPLEIIWNTTLFSIDFPTERVTEWGTQSFLRVAKNFYGVDSYQYRHYQWSGLVSNALLITLLIMHVWWFALLLRILARMIASSKPHEAGDAEYEGDSDHEKTD